MQRSMPKIMTAMKSVIKNHRKLLFSHVLVDVSGVAIAQALYLLAFSSVGDWPQPAAKFPPSDLLTGWPQKVWGQNRKSRKKKDQRSR